jgi:hypothetical protein
MRAVVSEIRKHLLHRPSTIDKKQTFTSHQAASTVEQAYNRRPEEV